MLIPALPIYTELLSKWASLSSSLEFIWEPHPNHNQFNQVKFFQKIQLRLGIRRTYVAHGWVARGGMLYLGNGGEAGVSFECDLKDPNCLVKLEKWFLDNPYFKG